jgi:PGF-pre-PGF domain-containing protein
MPRPAILALVIVAVVLVGSTGFAGADGDYTITVENGEIDVPDRTVNAPTGQDFTVTSVAPVEPGETLFWSVSTSKNEEYNIFRINSDRTSTLLKGDLSRESDGNFSTKSLDPGAYTLAVRESQDQLEFETIQPFVIEAYDATLASPSEVTEGDNLSVNIETTEHDNVDAPPIEKVELVIADDSTDDRIEAEKTDDGEYVVNTTAEYDPGEYRLYAAVYEDEEVENGELNMISMSGEQTLTVTEQENNTDENGDEDQNTDDSNEGSTGGTGGGGGGGGGAPSSNTAEVSNTGGDDIIGQQSATVEAQSNAAGSRVRFDSGSPVEEITFVADDIEGTVNVTSTTAVPDDVDSPEQMPLQVSEISVPDTARNSSAQLRMSVSADRLNQSNVSATDLRITRFTNGTWTTLNTTVIEETTEQVKLEATTPGFSYFAVTAVTESESTDGSDPASSDGTSENENDTQTDNNDEAGGSGGDGTIQPNDTDGSEDTGTDASTPGFEPGIAIISLLITIAGASLYGRCP